MPHFRHFSKLNKPTSPALFIHHVVTPYHSGLSPLHLPHIWEHKTVHCTFDVLSQAPNSRSPNCFIELAEHAQCALYLLHDKGTYCPTRTFMIFFVQAPDTSLHHISAAAWGHPLKTDLLLNFTRHPTVISDLWTSHSINPSFQQIIDPHSHP